MNLYKTQQDIYIKIVLLIKKTIGFISVSPDIQIYRYRT